MFYNTTTHFDPSEPHLGKRVETELEAGAMEVERRFFTVWSEEGYTQYASDIDVISELEIDLDAAEHFDANHLEALEYYVDHMNPYASAAEIETFYNTLP